MYGQENKRSLALDIAKGIGILLVVLGHCAQVVAPIKQWIYSFHVPLFFLIAGMVWDRASHEIDPIDTCSWWLRTPGWDRRHTSQINYASNIYDFGELLHLTHVAVRPSIWLNPELPESN